MNFLQDLSEEADLALGCWSLHIMVYWTVDCTVQCAAEWWHTGTEPYLCCRP